MPGAGPSIAGPPSRRRTAHGPGGVDAAGVAWQVAHMPPPSTPLVTVALDRNLDLRRQRPEGAQGVAGLPGYVCLPGAPAVHLFAFGAAVIEAQRIDPAIVDRLRAATGAERLADTEETWQVDGGASEPWVGWDRVALPTVDGRSLAMVALLLGQSAALERYDRQANALVDEVLAILGQLRTRGRLEWSRGSLTRRIAGIAAAQLELTRSFFLVDRPDTTWEDPVSGKVFDVLYEHLELEERHAAIQEKLETLSSTLRTVSDLQQGRQGLQLEMAIVALIVVELLLALYRG